MSSYVAILSGGWSNEREVSLITGAAVEGALIESGYRVKLIDVGKDVSSLLTSLDPKPDVVFNALHGRYGEDGCIQGLLNYLDVPYTHSGVLASALAFNKPVAKAMMVAAGIKVAEHQLATYEQFLDGNVMTPPFVVKPQNEGSSVGVRIVQVGDVFKPKKDEWVFGEELMIEKFIPGRELTVTVMGDRPLAVTEVITGRNFYDYDAKYIKGGSKHILPAELPKVIYDEALQVSLLAHNTLKCRGISRVDIS
ncbi:MAG: D-alanine--D-alanine ligase [Pseudomonadota bacterium]|nr:D-alanine--D-alanine ligase [Pseudomonadota bacterium]